MWLCSLLEQMPAKENQSLGRLELPLLFFASLISPPSEKPFNRKFLAECQDAFMAQGLVQICGK
jgi:hypothetical protein